MKWISRLYIFFVGILLAMTTGFGVAAFYPEPQAPQYPVSRTAPLPESCYSTPEAQRSQECQDLLAENQAKEKAEQDAYQERMNDYQNRNAGYTRTAVFLGILIGAIYAMFGLFIIKTSPLVANGFMLGAVLTAILTRLLISLASLGSNTTGTEGANAMSYIQFLLLVVVTVGVTVAGFRALPDEQKSKK